MEAAPRCARDTPVPSPRPVPSRGRCGVRAVSRSRDFREPCGGGLNKGPLTAYQIASVGACAVHLGALITRDPTPATPRESRAVHWAGLSVEWQSRRVEHGPEKGRPRRSRGTPREGGLSSYPSPRRQVLARSSSAISRDRAPPLAAASASRPDCAARSPAMRPPRCLSSIR